MDFSTLIIIVIVLGVLGAIGTVLFWIGVGYFGVKAVQNCQKEMDSMRIKFSSSVSDLQNTYGDQIPPAAQQQIITQYLQAQDQLNQFDKLSRQEHDLFVSELASEAASVGIDVKGG